jgi:DNA polymerase-3 subunit alpha
MARGMMRVPTYYQDLYDVIGNNPGHVIGSTACFREGTMVETKEGWKPIEYIKKGDYVLNRYGEWEEVIEPTCNWYNGWMYKIEFSGNENPIICTENHQFLTITGNSKIPKWTQAKDLIIDRGNTKHICLRPFNKNYPFKDNFIINKKEFLHSYFKDSNYSHKSYVLPEQIIITPELMRLFGLFLGDGCLSLKEKPRLSFTLNIKEFEVYYQSFIREAGKQLGIVWNVNRSEKNNRVDITSSCVELIDLFYWLFGDVKANNKYIPERLKINDELSYELIFGYLLADGYFRIRKPTETIKYPTGEFVVASISKRLAYDFYELLNQLGITTNISYSKGGYRNNCNHQDSWYLQGSNKFIGNLCKTKLYTHNDIVKCFNDAIQYKKKDFCVIDNVHYRKIRIKDKKIQLSHEYVYCLNNTTHSFKCENVIVHNCLGGALPTQLLKYRANNSEDLYERIKIWCNQLKKLFGEGNFYLEMQPSRNEEQIYVNRNLIKLSEELNIPYIITNDSHYLKKEDINIHHAFLNAQGGDRETESFYATTYLMNTEEIYEYMGQTLGLEVLQKAFNNICEIRDKCEDYSLMHPLRIPYLPKNPTEPNESYYNDLVKYMPMMELFKNSEYDSDRHLLSVVLNKVKEDSQYQTDETYKEINTCLKSVWDSSEASHTRWSAYLMNVRDYIEIAWKDGDTLVGPSRGSGGGFILLNILGITQINPLREKTKTFHWRFMNPERVSPLDIDIDIEGSKREKVYGGFQKHYGADRVSKVLTLRTEKSKSAVLTAARGLGIDVDIAQYLSSMITADRGILRTLKQTAYGDEDNDIPVNNQFRFEMEENYPELWEVAQRIEGLICGVGSHAGGIIFVDEPFYKTTALMKTSNGDVVTQFDLHDAEDVGLIKIDLLSIEALDKIHICLDLLCDNGYVEREKTLRDTYEKVLGIYNIERDNIDMWKMCWNHEVMSLFQMEKQSGIQGIALTHPSSVDDLATINSVMRLMASEKGAEQPLNKYARYKEDINLWYDEMRRYGLTEDEIQWLRGYLDISFGICETQEKLMSIVQDERVGGHSLLFADRLRKSIAKKKPKEFLECEKEFFETVEEKHLSKRLADYVWNVVFKIQRGYSFCAAHTLAYSLVGLQELNLAFKYPIVFWNCACLIADSGGAETEDEEEYEVEIDREESYTNCIEDFVDENNNEEEEEDDEEDDGGSVKKKKKTKTTNFGKIATAIGKMKSIGIEVAPPNINKSGYTFSPEVESNTIRYGLSGITRVGEDVIQSILLNRPYSSISDFLGKVKLSKPQMVNLIKSGAFDDFGNSREEVMENYIRSVSDQKKRVTLQNMKMLIDFNLIPEELDFEKRVFNFNKYLKKFKSGTNYLLDDVAMVFFDKHFDVDNLIPVNEEGAQFAIKQTVWDKIYTKKMDKVRAFIKSHYDELLTAMNNRLIKDLWDKYCSGSISKWEMDSVSYYSHDHELKNVDEYMYGFVDFFDLPENPDIDKIITIKGKQVPLFKLSRIIGTVLDKDKMKKTVTLLTKTGVVTVKIYGAVYTHYDRQISEKNPVTGKKKVIEKSIFSRGNKIIVTGIRRGDEFLAKKYAKTPYHLVELIEEINEDGTLITRTRES